MAHGEDWIEGLTVGLSLGSRNGIKYFTPSTMLNVYLRVDVTVTALTSVSENMRVNIDDPVVANIANLYVSEVIDL
jgi:hypothetical protein